MTGEARAVRRMARREASAHLMLAAYGRTVRVRPVVRACPWCGADTRPAWAFPLRAWERGHDWAPESAGEVTLAMLGCEAVAARSLLPLVAAAEAGVREFSTRAATWVRLGQPDMETLDDVESRVDEGVRTLPLSARKLPGAGADAAAWRTSLESHFLTPHCQDPRFKELNELYQAERLNAVEEGLRTPAAQAQVQGVGGL